MEEFGATESRATRCGRLEFLTMNAKQGAFHWIGPVVTDPPASSRAEPDGGIVFDCGTMWGGGKRLDKSIDFLSGHIGRRHPALLIVSHYHRDHISHVDKLMERFRDLGLPLPEVWVPAIDQFSMNLYLRILAFGALLKRGKTQKVSDTFIEKLLGRQQVLSNAIFRKASNAVVKTVSRHSMGAASSAWKVTPLSPPSFPQSQSHPLSSDVAMVQHLMRSEGEAGLLERAAYSLVYSEVRTRGFDRHMREAFPEDTLDGLRDIASNVVDVLRSEAGDDANGHSVRVLRAFLAFSAFTPASTPATRLDVSGRVSPNVPAHMRLEAGRWDEVIRNATHLFNLAVLVEGAEDRVILTGDADPLLHPMLSRSQADPLGTGFAVDEDGIAPSLHVDVVQAPHHGSEKNVVWDSYRAWQPAAVIVSANKFGKWRHPSSRLGSTIRGAKEGTTSALYCTNYNPNSPLCQAGPCGLSTREVDAVSVFGDGSAQWLSGAAREPAQRCPHV